MKILERCRYVLLGLSTFAAGTAHSQESPSDLRGTTFLTRWDATDELNGIDY